MALLIGLIAVLIHLALQVPTTAPQLERPVWVDTPEGEVLCIKSRRGLDCDWSTIRTTGGEGR